MSVTPPVVLHSERNNSPSPPLFPSSFYAGHNSVLTRGEKRSSSWLWVGPVHFSLRFSLLQPSRGGGGMAQLLSFRSFFSFADFGLLLLLLSTFLFHSSFPLCDDDDGEEGGEKGRAKLEKLAIFLFISLPR